MPYRSITVRSAITIAVTGAVLFTIQSYDLLSPERLRNLDPRVPFTIGIFSLLLSQMLFRFANFYREPKYHFVIVPSKEVNSDDLILISIKGISIAISQNPNLRSWEIFPRMQQAIYFAAFVGVGLLTFSGRSVNLLATLPTQLTFSSGSYCSAPKKELDERPEQFGCELVYRAMELGYAKSLGSCKKSEAQTTQPPCTLRRHDEPYLHFAARRLMIFGNFLANRFSKKQRRIERDRTNQQARFLGDLYQHQRLSITDSPRSQHLIWTNLPPPDPSLRGKVTQFLFPNDCIDSNARLDRSLELIAGQSQSQIVNHLVGHLLFAPHYEKIVGYCKEFTIHWDAAYQSCLDLANNPQEFLKRQGHWEGVKDVYDRHRVANTILHLNDRPLSDDVKNQAKIAPLKRALSFQCLLQNPDATETTAYSNRFSLFGKQFTIHTVVLPKANQQLLVDIDLYHDIARLLAQNYRYSALNSMANIDPTGDQNLLAAFFDSDRFLITKLDLFRNMDIFVGHQWILKRPDLLEIYPYHLHLQRFVDRFRDQYSHQRGRL